MKSIKNFVAVCVFAIGSVFGVTNTDYGQDLNVCELSVTKDSTVYTSNQGTNDYLIIGQHTGYPLKRSLVEFEDISGCTCDSNSILSANMYLYYVYSHKASSQSVDVAPKIFHEFQTYQVLKDWTETGVTSTTTGITGVDWNVDYLGTDGSDADRYMAGRSTQFYPSFNGNWIEFDITKAAQNWQSGEENYGLLVKVASEEYEGRDIRFFSSDYSSGEYAPKLFIWCQN